MADTAAVAEGGAVAGRGGCSAAAPGKGPRAATPPPCFPLSLRQLLPLLDVVSTANKHVAKVRGWVWGEGLEQDYVGSWHGGIRFVGVLKV